MQQYAEQNESLWILTMGPLVWALHFALSYGTAALYCGMVAGRVGSATTVKIAIGIYTIVALSGILAAGWVGFRRHRARMDATPHDADHPEDRHQFLGFASLLLSGLSAVATMYAAMVILYFDTCH